jgi:hypothetical protein
MKRLMKTAVAGVCVAFFIRCGSPFFPDTGMPDGTKPLRTTPQGVITQLIESYEQQRIDLFEDLFPPFGTFRFYTSPAFADTMRNRGFPSEPRDTLLQWITAPYYYYWTQQIEVSEHKNMFAQAFSIRFTVRPSVDPGDFRYRVVNGDTTNVEILMTDGQIDIATSEGTATVAIERQVFFLERAPDSLWVIRKWYDLGIQP